MTPQLGPPHQAEQPFLQAEALARGAEEPGPCTPGTSGAPVRSSRGVSGVPFSSRLLAEQRGPVGLAGLRLPRNAVSGTGVGLAAAAFRTSSPQLLGVSNGEPPGSAPSLRSLFLDFHVTVLRWHRRWEEHRSRGLGDSLGVGQRERAQDRCKERGFSHVDVLGRRGT